MAFTPLPSGTLLSKRYKITGLIRRGGMGATYQGEDLETGKPVAIKQLLESFESKEERESGIGNFLSEIAVLKTIRHPQIPRILDHFFAEKLGFFFVLEFVKGRDFTTILKESPQGLSEEEVIEVGIGVCRILRYLHEMKPTPVIHRDIKSSNLMKRVKDGAIILVDFGIARATKPKEGMMIGTLGYAPPEQHMNRTDPRSDIYSLGASLHELATGQRPHPDRFDFAPPHELRPQLSFQLSEIILTATRINPEERFQDAETFEEALKELHPAPILLPHTNSFFQSCARLHRDILIPQLEKLRGQYPNEILTHDFSESFDHFIFTLGISIPYSLILTVNEDRESIVFYLREGLLSPIVFGELSPESPDAPEKLSQILEKFLKVYEDARGFSA